ncbi:MAG: hypothetical protein M3O34_03025, partial [Chloroflexota bacterium]|nr:hypothetical protein [Chloroflexota bacterium]
MQGGALHARRAWRMLLTIVLACAWLALPTAIALAEDDRGAVVGTVTMAGSGAPVVDVEVRLQT